VPDRMHITVVIPCFNAADTLGRLLESLRVQTLSSSLWDAVVVDDGSVDASRAQVERFDFVSVLTQNRRGAGAARNAGARAATGDILLFLDADVEAAPDLLERHLEYHERFPGVAAVGGAVAPRSPLRVFEWRTADYLSSWFNAHPGIAAGGRPEYQPGLNFSVKRRVVFIDGGLAWPETLLHGGEDVLFCLALRHRGLRLAFCPTALVRHRDRETCRGYCEHMYHWGFHAPFVRGQHSGLRFGFLFPPGPAAIWMLAPIIICGYTGLIWRAWVRSRPALATLAIPQILVGRVAYMVGVLDGVRALRSRSCSTGSRKNCAARKE